MAEELVVSLQEALRTMDWTSGSSVEEPVGSYHPGIYFWRYSGPNFDRCLALGDVAAKDGMVSFSPAYTKYKRNFSSGEADDRPT